MKKALILFASNTTRTHGIFEQIKRHVGSEFELEDMYLLTDIRIIKKNNELTFTLHGKDLSSYSLIYLYNIRTARLDVAALIGQYCLAHNIHIINTREAHAFTAGKVLQKLLFTLHGIPTPDFVFFSKVQSSQYEEIVSLLGTPFIAKASKDTQGAGVLMISTKEDFDTNFLLAKDPLAKDGLWYFEKYLPHTHSVRGFVTGNRCDVKITVSAETESFKTNHGIAVFSKNTDEVFAAICVKAAQLMLLEVSGVDTVINEEDQSIQVLEANKSPGITITEEQEAQAISTYLISKLKEND